MSTFMSWLFHRGRTDECSGGVARTSRPRSGHETGQERRVASSTTEDRTDTSLDQPSGEPLFVDFGTLGQRQSALLEGLTPVSEQAALVSFVGTGITEPNRYEDAAGAFNQLWLMAPVDEGALIQVFRQHLREEALCGSPHKASMLGECNWVRNVRAAEGRATLRRRRARAVRLFEVPVDERARVIRRYVERVPGGRPHIPVDRHEPVEAFEPIASKYPVFRVVPL